jgi:hypothetical protein
MVNRSKEPNKREIEMRVKQGKAQENIKGEGMGDEWWDFFILLMKSQQ